MPVAEEHTATDDDLGKLPQVSGNRRYASVIHRCVAQADKKAPYWQWPIGALRAAYPRADSGRQKLEIVSDGE